MIKSFLKFYENERITFFRFKLTTKYPTQEVKLDLNHLCYCDIGLECWRQICQMLSWGKIPVSLLWLHSEHSLTQSHVLEAPSSPAALLRDKTKGWGQMEGS